MAYTIDAFPANYKRRLYPWKQWLNGEVWVLESGKDYKVSTENFRAAAYATARRHNKRIKTLVRGNDLVLQAK